MFMLRGTKGLISITVSLIYIELAIGLPAEITFTKGSDALKYAPLVDGHNDLPFGLYTQVDDDLSNFPFEKNLENDEFWGNKVFNLSRTDLPRLTAGKVGAQFWVAYVDCKSQYKDAVSQTLRQIDVIKRLVNKYPENLAFVTKADDIEKTWREGKIASLIGVEGGHSLDSSLAILRLYHELGVRYVTLTHFCNTPWADGSPALTKSVYNVTEFGKVVVSEMNRLGMLVDLSHVSHNVMRIVLDITKAPVIFSHSSAYAICEHHRNVPDDVLLKVKENKGIVMVNFYPDYINSNKSLTTTIDMVVDHINYIRNLIGVDYVGLGSDFNGIDKAPVGLEDVSKFPDLFDRLYANKEGAPKWSREDLEKLAGRNLIRVLKAVEKVSDTLKTQQPYENVIAIEEVNIAQEREGLQPGSCQTKTIWNEKK